MDTLSPDERRIVYARLVRGYADTAADGLPVASQWDYLMAAHVVGQHDAAMHLDSHRRMLALARATGDWREALGQLARIALVPVRHLLRRIPSGTVGRASPGCTRATQPSQIVRELIEEAADATELPPLQ